MGSRIEGGGVIGGDEPLDGLKGDCHPNMLQRMRNRVDKSMLVRFPTLAIKGLLHIKNKNPKY
jgi:hypothetical protein